MHRPDFLLMVGSAAEKQNTEMAHAMLHAVAIAVDDCNHCTDKRCESCGYGSGHEQ